MGAPLPRDDPGAGSLRLAFSSHTGAGSALLGPDPFARARASSAVAEQEEEAHISPPLRKQSPPGRPPAAPRRH